MYTEGCSSLWFWTWMPANRLSSLCSQCCALAFMPRSSRANTAGTTSSTTAAMEYVTDKGMLTAYTCSVVNMSDHTVRSSAGPIAMALMRSMKGASA